VTKRGVAAGILEKDAVIDLVLQPQMAVAEQIDIHHLNVRPVRAES
jgi:hypothetical protein